MKQNKAMRVYWNIVKSSKKKSKTNLSATTVIGIKVRKLLIKTSKLLFRMHQQVNRAAAQKSFNINTIPKQIVGKLSDHLKCPHLLVNKVNNCYGRY